MILVGHNEILLHFTGIPVVFKILHKLYLAITREKLHPGKAGSLFVGNIPFQIIVHCSGK